MTSLSLEGRFDLAYGAAHAFALAALRLHGYRTDLRYVVFQSLEQTLGVTRDVWRILDKAHGARNAADYGGTFQVNERLLRDTLAATTIVRQALMDVRATAAPQDALRALRGSGRGQGLSECLLAERAADREHENPADGEQ